MELHCVRMGRTQEWETQFTQRIDVNQEINLNLVCLPSTYTEIYQIHRLQCLPVGHETFANFCKSPYASIFTEGSWPGSLKKRYWPKLL